MPPATRTSETAVVVATAVVGSVLLLGARPVLRALGGDGAGAVVTTRVLGARYLLQAAAVAARPRALLPAVAVVDVLHAASMVPVAALSPRHRAPAVASAGVAVALAAASWWAGRRPR